MELPAGPFSALSLIVAPAVLTNACSVLALSTSNRLARAVDRARELQTEAIECSDAPGQEPTAVFHDLRATHRRVLMLIRALRFFYSALGGFATCALLSVLGASLAPYSSGTVAITLETLPIISGVLAVGALIMGVTLIVRETRVVVEVLEDQIRRAEARFPMMAEGPRQKVA